MLFRIFLLMTFFTLCLLPAYLKVHKLYLLQPSLTSSKLPADINLYAFSSSSISPSSVLCIPPCLQPQNKPKQHYQKSYGLGAKCWLCWIESFEVYRALRLKCHHWNLSIIFSFLIAPASPPLPPISIQTAVGWTPVCSLSPFFLPFLLFPVWNNV